MSETYQPLIKFFDSKSNVLKFDSIKKNIFQSNLFEKISKLIK